MTPSPYGSARPERTLARSTPSSELACEPALPDAGLAVDREQVRAAVAHRARERVLEQLELRVAADERGAGPERPRTAVERVQDAPGAERGPEPLELERARVLDARGCPREAIRRRAEQDLSRRRRLLQTRGHVHRLTCHERRVARLVDDELAGLDPDPGCRPSSSRRPHRQRGTGRALASSSCACGNAEGREHGVARELLHDAAVQRDAVRDRLEELVHASPYDLGIGARDEARRVDEVDEQDRRELALHP